MNKSKKNSKKMQEFNDGSTESKDIKVRVAYDPVFNSFFLQAQNDVNKDIAVDYAPDSENNPNIKNASENSPVIYGSGVKRYKVQGTPNVDLFKILNKLNAKPEKLEGAAEEEQTKDIASPTDDIEAGLSLSPEIKSMISGLEKQKKDAIETNKDVNYNYDVKDNAYFTKMVKDILDKGEGIILVSGFDWANANLPSIKESIADEYLNSDRSVDDILKECIKYIKK